MGRKQIISEYSVLTQANLAITTPSNATVVENVDSVRYVVDWTNGDGATDIDIELQQSNDGIAWKILMMNATPKISGASGNHIIDVKLIISKFLRLNFVRNAGQADVVAKVKGSTVGA